MKHQFKLMLAVALCAPAMQASEATPATDYAAKGVEAPIERPASPTAEQIIYQHGLYDALTNRTTLLGLLAGWTEFQLAQHYLNPIRTDAEMHCVHFNNPNWMSYITKPDTAATFLGQASRLRDPKKLVNSDARALAFSFLQSSTEAYDQELLKRHGFVPTEAKQETTPLSPRSYAQVAASPRTVATSPINDASIIVYKQEPRSTWLPMLTRLRAEQQRQLLATKDELANPLADSDTTKMPHASTEAAAAPAIAAAGAAAVIAPAQAENPFIKQANPATDKSKSRRRRQNKNEHRK